MTSLSRGLAGALLVVAAGLFAVFDIAELIHRLDVSRAGRTVLAGVVAMAHLGAAAAAANAARRSQPRVALTF